MWQVRNQDAQPSRGQDAGPALVVQPESSPNGPPNGRTQSIATLKRNTMLPKHVVFLAVIVHPSTFSHQAARIIATLCVDCGASTSSASRLDFCFGSGGTDWANILRLEEVSGIASQWEQLDGSEQGPLTILAPSGDPRLIMKSAPLASWINANGLPRMHDVQIEEKSREQRKIDRLVEGVAWCPRNEPAQGPSGKGAGLYMRAAMEDQALHRKSWQPTARRLSALLAECGIPRHGRHRSVKVHARDQVSGCG
jgi:hypothetical protein